MAELEAGTRPEDVARAEAGVDEARAALENAEIQYQRQQSLARSDFASREALDDARTARDRAAAQLRRAEEEPGAGPRRPPAGGESPPPAPAPTPWPPGFASLAWTWPTPRSSRLPTGAS